MNFDCCGRDELVEVSVHRSTVLVESYWWAQDCLSVQKRNQFACQNATDLAVSLTDGASTGTPPGVLPAAGLIVFLMCCLTASSVARPILPSVCKLL